jgi:hypothetical protein
MNGFPAFPLKLTTRVHFNTSFEYDPYVGFELLFDITAPGTLDDSAGRIAGAVVGAVAGATILGVVIASIVHPPFGKKVMPFMFKKHDTVPESVTQDRLLRQSDMNNSERASWQSSARPREVTNA